MAMRLNPYLNFDGTTAEAMAFYQQALGGELLVHTFGESGAPPEVNPDGVMHAMLETPSGFTLMASDLPPGMEGTPGNMTSVSLSGDDEAELRGFWAALSEGATIVMELEPQMWGDTYGQLIDRFGTSWMVNILGDQPES